MRHTLQDIARATGLELRGDGTVEVYRAAAPHLAGGDDLAVAMAPSYADALKGSECRAALVWPDADLAELDLDAALLAPRPRVAMAHATEFFQHPFDTAPGIHPTAVVADTAEIGDGAAIGPFAVINSAARIGPGAQIAAHVTIGSDAQIGARFQANSGARIGARCILGDDVIIHANAVIGSDGFSFEPPDRSAIEALKTNRDLTDTRQIARFLRIHSLAAVEIGNDVEIGAATTIDRGTIEPTRVGSGTKIDNQVQLGHNVQIGQTCLLCAQVGIAGSTTVGDRVVLGGKVGIADHVNIGSDVVCAAATMVPSSIPDGSVMMGMPATTREKATSQFMAIKRLPRLVEQVAEIRKKLGL
ncbi:MAG: UDP-3-O-(3-hydroxymyristoyl)glucosamine N-acyltransferase [Pseudomonadota bacterium]